MNLISKLSAVVEYPTLLKTIGKKIDKSFVKDILMMKQRFNFIPNTIIDIGAAVGEWSKAANFVYPNTKIYAFEPISDSLDKAKKLLKNIPSIEYYNIALYSANEKKQFYLNDFSFSSSLLKMTDIHKKTYPFTKNETIIDIVCKRFDSINNINLKKPVYVKIDVQGTELEVLKGFGQLIKDIDIVQIELNFEKYYEKQFNYNEIFNFFYERNFKKFYQLHPLFYDSKLQACDYLFLK